MIDIHINTNQQLKGAWREHWKIYCLVENGIQLPNVSLNTCASRMSFKREVLAFTDWVVKRTVCAGQKRGYPGLKIQRPQMQPVVESSPTN